MGFVLNKSKYNPSNCDFLIGGKKNICLHYYYQKGNPAKCPGKCRCALSSTVLEAKVDIALRDQRVCSGRYLDLMTGPFRGTVELKLSVILGKLAYNAHWSSHVNRIQTAFNLVEKTALTSGFGPCPHRGGTVGNTVLLYKVETVQWKWKSV